MPSVTAATGTPFRMASSGVLSRLSVHIFLIVYNKIDAEG
jgi:hypothetical protein